MPETRSTNTASPLVSEFAHDADMAEVVQTFVAEVPERIRALEEAWAGQRREALTRLAHQLRGCGAGYGFPALSLAAGELEDALSGGPAGRVPQQAARPLDRLLELCRRVRAA